tara:strand:- start:1233 stop:1757 length:525 start_codon:yes stop_codon:yes gene_type:complete
MIRILSGKLKGRKLKQFNLDSLRPTQAKIRKSMMDTLMPFDDKKVLDIFSGVGSLGIEAISRGARSVLFVDNSPKAINILKKNINMLNLEEVVQVKLFDAIKFLKKTEMTFDVVIADPPYYKYNFNDMLHLVKPILNEDGIFCFESNNNKIAEIESLKIKNFGNTQLVFWRKNE